MISFTINSDPPLDEEDVPQGEWACRRCKTIEQLDKEDNDLELESNDSQKLVFENKCQLIESDEEMDSKSELTETQIIRKPLSLLIRAAQMLNPKQFQLPNEMMPSIQLVGTSKKVNLNSHNCNRNALKKQIHELDNGLVSFPIKLCYQCSKSCRKAPLIQCDYCPLLFHGDCLDPPLTVMPTGRWMCPNHSQHIIEQKLLDSVSLSERIKLWNQFSGHLSQDTVKIDFLKKAHRKHAPFRSKIVLPQSNRVIVPNAIKQMYKSPPPLLPNINSFNNDLINNNDVNSLSVNEVKNECLNSHFDKPTPEQQDEWLSSIVAFQSSVAQHLFLKKNTDPKAKSSIDDNCSLSQNSSNSNNVIIKEESPSKTKENHLKYNNSQNSLNGPLNHSCSDNSLKNTKNVYLSEPLNKMTENINQLNGNKNQTSPLSSLAEDKRISTQTNSLHLNIDNIGDIDMNLLDEKLVRVLAWQRLQQLLPSNKSENNVNSIGAQNPNTLSTPHPTVKRICLGDVRARAVLCPVFIRSSSGSLNTNSSGPAIAMSYRTLTIGTGADNDVILGNYGYCNYVSSRHASIFYDEVLITNIFILFFEC